MSLRERLEELWLYPWERDFVDAVQNVRKNRILSLWSCECGEDFVDYRNGSSWLEHDGHTDGEIVFICSIERVWFSCDRCGDQETSSSQEYESHCEHGHCTVLGSLEKTYRKRYATALIASAFAVGGFLWFFGTLMILGVVPK